MRKVTFKGEPYLLVSDWRASPGSALATQAQYEQGVASFAHVCPDGQILRYGQVIGSVNDLEMGETIDEDQLQLSGNWLEKVLNDPSWNAP